MPNRRVLALAAAVLLLPSAMPAAAQPSPTHKAQLVAQLLTVTDARRLGERMLRPLIVQAERSLRRRMPTLPKRALEIVNEEFARAYKEHESELMQPAARVYAASLSEAELEEAIAYYRSPVGRKAVATAPGLMATTAQIGYVLGEQAARHAYKRAMARIEHRPPGPAASCSAPVPDISAAKQAPIDAIFSHADAERTAERLAERLVDPLLAAVMRQAHRRQPSLPDSQSAIIRQAVTTAVKTCAPQITAEGKMLYARAFSLEELQGMATFMSSPVGRKMVALNQRAAAASAQAGMALDRRIGETAMRRATVRLKQEGLIGN